MYVSVPERLVTLLTAFSRQCEQGWSGTVNNKKAPSGALFIACDNPCQACSQLSMRV
jgi:hypothetical protein